MSTIKPLPILQLRPEDEASDDEFRAFLQYGNLTEADVHRVRMEEEGVPEVTLNDYSAVIVGGGPWNVSDTAEKKSVAQKAAEERLYVLLANVIAVDFPYLGMCYGIGTLSCALDGVVSKERYGEPAGPVEIFLTPAAQNDPLLVDLSERFTAFCGHKEACQAVPEGAELLASSDACPVQMFRVKQHVYAVQFHTELDQKGLEVRVDAYKHHGYFDPEEGEALKELARTHTVTEPMKILERFVERYRASR